MHLYYSELVNEIAVCSQINFEFLLSKASDFGPFAFTHYEAI